MNKLKLREIIKVLKVIVVGSESKIWVQAEER